MQIDYNARIDQAIRQMRSRSLDSFLVTNATNVSYLSPFRGHDAVMLLTHKKRFFITDSRYIEEVRKTLGSYDIVMAKESLYKTLRSLAVKNRLKKFGFESMNLPYEVAGRLKDAIKTITLIPVSSLVEDLRSVKDKYEIRFIRESIRLTKAVLNSVSSLIKPGLREDTLAVKIKTETIRRGGEASFDPIVAAGANSSMPHARAGKTEIARNSFVMIDMGCRLNLYNSDITRIVIVGKCQKRFKKIYDIVQKAREKAIDAIRPGIRISEIDNAARRYIQISGFGKCFGHSLGHGVGLDVHESPTISRTNEGTLKSGMVFTVEPAIYIPGFGGVRIEDIILVTDDGCEVLT